VITVVVDSNLFLLYQTTNGSYPGHHHLLRSFSSTRNRREKTTLVISNVYSIFIFVTYNFHVLDIGAHRSRKRLVTLIFLCWGSELGSVLIVFVSSTHKTLVLRTGVRISHGLESLERLRSFSLGIRRVVFRDHVFSWRLEVRLKFDLFHFHSN